MLFELSYPHATVSGLKFITPSRCWTRPWLATRRIPLRKGISPRARKGPCAKPSSIVPSVSSPPFAGQLRRYMKEVWQRGRQRHCRQQDSRLVTWACFAEGGKVTEGIPNLTQTIQEQVLKSAQDFYGNSLGSLK